MYLDFHECPHPLIQRRYSVIRRQQQKITVTFAAVMQNIYHLEMVRRSETQSITGHVVNRFEANVTDITMITCG